MSHEPSSSSESPVAAGRDIGRYRAGDADVQGHSLITDPVLERTVSGRVVPLAQAEALEREAKFLGALDHTGAPLVIDVVRGESEAVLVMRQVKGISLSEAIRSTAAGSVTAELADPVAVVQTMIKVCDVVTAAHAKGVVHHRLSTDHIIIGQHGQVEVRGWQTAMAANRDGLHDDVRGLARCLFSALVLRAPRAEGEDVLGALTPAERTRLPATVEAIIRLALISDLTTGYHSIAEFGIELHRYLAAQIVDATIAVSPKPAGILTTVVLTVMATAAVMAVVLFLPRWRPANDWGKPILEEDFSDSSYKSRWVEEPTYKGMFTAKDGKLVSIAERSANIALKQRLTAPLAIEYTGEFLPGSDPCDLAVTWDEGSSLGNDPQRKQVLKARKCLVAPGNSGNTSITITVSGHSLPVAYLNRQLESGRRYRIRVEFEGNFVTLFMDGEKTLSYYDICPFTSGYVGLYAHWPGKAFDDLKIYQKPPATAFTPLSFGDVLMQPGQYEAAEAVYERIVETDATSAMGQSALFRMGLAEWRQDKKKKAIETWSRVTQPDLQDQIECFTIEGERASWHLPSYFARFSKAYQEKPSMRAGLRQTWQSIMEQLTKEDQEVAENFLALRSALFADDETGKYIAARSLMLFGRFEECIAQFPQDRSAFRWSLLALGRSDDVLADVAADVDTCTKAWQMRGELDKIITAKGVNPTFRVLAQCKLGKGGEALDDPENRHPVLLHMGRADELLNSRPLTIRACNEALIGTGRYAEAAGAGLPDIPNSGNDMTAMLLLGDITKAETVAKKPLIPFRFMMAAEAKDIEGLAKLHDQVVVQNDLRYVHSGWFVPTIVRPLVDRWNGDHQAIENQLRPQLEQLSKTFGKRGWFVSRAVLGDIEPEAVMEMTAATEAGAWRLVATAIRAELAGHPDEARVAYAAFAALPIHQRLLALNVPDAEVEWFVAWRLRALTKQ